MISYTDSEEHAVRTAVTRAVITDFARLFYVDLYRLDDGKIVEHWDVIQPIPETACNDHPLL